MQRSTIVSLLFGLNIIAWIILLGGGWYFRGLRGSLGAPHDLYHAMRVIETLAELMRQFICPPQVSLPGSTTVTRRTQIPS